MSECVVRMDMPKNNCEMAVEIKGVGDWCPIMAKVCDYYSTKKMPDWCPIICQLPDGHGRLVDADAIKLPKGFFEKVDNVPKFYEWLNSLSTIVPAERIET